MGDQYSGFEVSLMDRSGGGSETASFSDPESLKSLQDSLSSLSSSSTSSSTSSTSATVENVFRLGRASCSCCCWTCCCFGCCSRELTFDGGENFCFSLSSGYLFSFAPLASRPRFRTSMLGELARLVDGVRSESSSVGVVEFCPEKSSKVNQGFHFEPHIFYNANLKLALHRQGALLT